MSSFYIEQQDMENAWGELTMKALFDDQNNGVLNTVAIQSVIARASARVTAKMPHNYTAALPFVAPIPELIKDATLEYATAFSIPRNPDYMKEVGLKFDTIVKRADALMEEIRMAIIRLIDSDQPVPTNVGGSIGTIVGGGVSGTSSSTCLRRRFFYDMGDW
jgi:hypothetical protein